MIYFYSLIALILVHFAWQIYNSVAAPTKIGRVIRDVVGLVKNGGFLYLLFSLATYVDASNSITNQKFNYLYQMIIGQIAS